MNKTQLIEAITSKSGLSKTETKRCLSAFMEVVSETLKEGDKITLVGFGTFSVEKRSERMGRHPMTKAPIKIAAKNVVKFRPGQELNESVK